MNVFAKEDIEGQYYVLSYYIDLYFPKNRLAEEIDEKGHLERNENKEEERENKIKEALKCEFISINPSKEKFNIFVEIGKIYNSVDDIKEKRRNKLIDERKRKHKKYTDKIKKRNKEIVDKLIKL